MAPLYGRTAFPISTSNREGCTIILLRRSVVMFIGYIPEPIKIIVNRHRLRSQNGVCTSPLCSTTSCIRHGGLYRPTPEMAGSFGIISVPSQVLIFILWAPSPSLSIFWLASSMQSGSPPSGTQELCTQPCVLPQKQAYLPSTSKFHWDFAGVLEYARRHHHSRPV